MTEGVVVALIGAGAVVIAAVITAVFSAVGRAREKRLRKVAEAKQRETETAALHPTLPTGTPEFAFTVDRQITINEFDHSGAGVNTKRLVGIRTKQAITNLVVPYEHWASCPGAKLLEPRIQSDDAALGTTMRNVLRNDGGVRGEVVVNGYHSPESSPVSFDIIQPFEKIYCLTKEEADGAYGDAVWKTEYAAAYAFASTAALELEVRFPSSHSGISRPQVIVFFRGTETVVGSETERLKRSLMYHDGIAHLEVQAPNPKLVYAIAWMPPSAKEQNASEQLGKSKDPLALPAPKDP